MNQSFPGRLFARMARLLPRSFREEYGADMQAMFERRLADARGRGPVSFLWFALRELAGLLRLAVIERAVTTRADTPPVARLHDREALSLMEHLTRETSHALRRLLRTPGFTAAVLFTLALAIGANTAIFALLHRIALSPLPYPAADRLLTIDHTAPGVGIPSGLGVNPGLYREYRKLPSIEAIAMYTSGERTLTGDGEAERMESWTVTPSLGGLLGVRPAAGRWFTTRDGEVGAPNVVLLSYALWQRRFAGAPQVVGRSLRIDGESWEVIGVAPRSLAFPEARAQLIFPLQLDPASTRLGGFNFRAIARLRPDVTLDDVRRQQEAIIARLPSLFPEDPGPTAAMVGDARLGAIPRSLKESIVGNTAQTLWVLLGAVAVVLLIACANLANLFLVRMEARSTEVAVRRAMGAGTSRIAAFFLAESMLVATASGVVGLLLGHWALQVLVANAPVALPRLQEVRIDVTVVAFTFLATLVAGTSFGLMPLLRLRPAVASILRDASRGNSASGSRMRTRQALMTTQVALALVLLSSAGLMIQSFQHLRRVDPGFQSDSRLVFRVGLAGSEYPTGDAAATFHEQVLEQLKALPGIRSAGLVTVLPLAGEGGGDPLDVRGREGGWDKVGPVVRNRRASPDYFTAMGIPLRAGRLLDAADASGTTNAVVIDEQTAKLYFPNEDPIGRQLRYVGNNTKDDWLTVVGVVGNTATTNLRESVPVAKFYAPLRTAIRASINSSHRATYVLHTSGNPIGTLPAVRRVIAELNPNVAIASPEPLADVVARAGASLAFTMILLVLAAAVALALGVIGVYAVISYSVAQRTTEIGVRLALGAGPADVVRMIVRQHAAHIGLGVLLGVGAAVSTARLMQALLFGVSWRHPLTYVAVSAALFMVAMLACWVPARRAAALSPTQALRS